MNSMHSESSRDKHAAATFPPSAAKLDREELEAVYNAAAAFIATTSVYRQRIESRPEFEALAMSLLTAHAGVMGRRMGELDV